MVHWGQLFSFFFCSVPVHVLTLALVIVYIRRLLFLMMMIGGGDSRVCANDYSFLLCHVLLFSSSFFRFVQKNKSSSSSDLVLALELVLFHCCNYSRFVPRCTAAAAAATTLIKLSINLTSSSSSFSDLGAFSFCYSVCSLCLLLSSLQL